MDPSSTENSCSKRFGNNTIEKHFEFVVDHKLNMNQHYDKTAGKANAVLDCINRCVISKAVQYSIKNASKIS